MVNNNNNDNNKNNNNFLVLFSQTYHSLYYIKESEDHLGI